MAMTKLDGPGDGDFDPQYFDERRGEGHTGEDVYRDPGIYPEADAVIDVRGWEEHSWLVRCQADLDRSPENPVLLRMRDNASARYYRAIADAHRDEREISDAATKNADLLDSPDVPADIKQFLVASAILIGVAILSGGAAGA